MTLLMVLRLTQEWRNMLWGSPLFTAADCCTTEFYGY